MTREEKMSFKKSTAREYFESIVIAVILALFVRTFVVQAFKIPTGSMENNLLIGDHLLVNKFVFGPSETGIERALLPMSTVNAAPIRADGAWVHWGCLPWFLRARWDAARAGLQQLGIGGRFKCEHV